MQNKEALAIRNMFGAISRRYDLANTLLSLGIHHWWRSRLVGFAKITKGQKILDCATGTGDLAFALARAVGSSGSVVATDFCREMVELAKEKNEKRFNHLSAPILFQTADVLNLPYPDGVFDVTTIAFGIRNVEDVAKALTEMSRVTKKGGQILILEFGQVNFPLFRLIYNLYARWILPWFGGLITGRPEAYRYLNQSSNEFPSGSEFEKILQRIEGFSEISFQSLSGGIAYLYRARRAH